MASIRKQQTKDKANAKRKTVSKPILSNPFQLEWPVLSAMALIQIEAALKTVLMPLVEAREAQLHHQPEASTSKQSEANSIQADSTAMAIDGPRESAAPVAEQSADESMAIDAIADTTESPMFASKRAQKRAKAAARVARREASGRPATHSLTLKSGRVIHVPNHVSQDRFEPKLLLDKDKARASERPEICDNLVLGINAVTRMLENEVFNGRRALAGLPEAKYSVTTQDSLRLVLPAPTKSTRRQRREVREEAHPDAKRARIDKIVRNKRREQDVGNRSMLESPPHALIPRDEVTLLHMLSEAKEECIGVAAAYQTVDRLDRAIRGLSGHSTLSVPEQDKGEPVKVDIDWLNDILALDRLKSSTKSILQYLFLRFIPGGRPAERERPDYTTRPTGGKWKPVNDPDARDGLKIKKDSAKKGKPELLAAAGSPKPKSIRVLFVAKADINPPSIVQHLLLGTAARNSVAAARKRQLQAKIQAGPGASVSDKTNEVYDEEPVYIVPMGEGFEHRLCELLAIRRAATLAISDCTAPGFEVLLQLLKHHLPTPVTADWLIPPISAPGSDGVPRYTELLPTTIKQLSVTVPTDPKAARAEKKAKRAERKPARKRQRENEQDSSKRSASTKKLKIAVQKSEEVELIPTENT